MIFSSNTDLIDSISGYVETTPISLDGANGDLEIEVDLDLPEGVIVVGNQNITVQIGISPIESSISFADIPVQIQGLAPDCKLRFHLILSMSTFPGRSTCLKAWTPQNWSSSLT